MAEKNTREEQAGEEDVVLSGLLIGGGLALLGAALYYIGGRYPSISGFDWLQMGGVLLVVAGIMIFLSGGITRSNAIEWMRSFGYALALALLIRWPIAEPYRIPSDSMLPTLSGDPGIGRGDRVFVNKWIYGVRYPFLNKRIWHGQDPQRWDIVVFKAVEEDAAHPTLVKRIVGMPGERIHIMNGRPYRFFKPDDRVPEPAEAPDLDFKKARRTPVSGTGEEWLFVPIALPDHMPDSIRYTSPPSAYSAMRYGVRLEDKYSHIPQGNYLLLGDNSGNSRDGRYWGWVPNEHLVGRVACIWWPPSNWRDFTGFSQTWWWRTLLAVLAILIVWRLFFGRSFAVHAAEDQGVDHLYIDFIGLGLRVPFTHYWFVQWGMPRRGDPVIYWAKTSESGHAMLLTGRVAALPGERIAFEEDQLRVDDTPPDLPELAEARFANRKEDGPYGRAKRKQHTEVPDNHLFILAVNEDDTTAVDSRRVGWVPRESLVGRVRVAWWPPTRWRKI